MSIECSPQTLNRDRFRTEVFTPASHKPSWFRLMWQFFVGAFALFLACRVSAQERATPTNLDIMRELAKNLTLELSSTLNTDRDSVISISVMPKDVAWYMESVVVEGFTSRGFVVREDVSLPTRAEFSLRDARVEYSNISREGLFGSKTVERTIRITLDSKLVQKSNGVENINMRPLTNVAHDTVFVSQVASLEHPTIVFTKGVMPREGFFSNLVEPFVVIGAIAVAVFLLFNVRS
jgi:hypothetical protein